MKFFSSQNSLWAILGGFLLLALGIVFLVLLGINSFKDFPIWFMGDSAIGIVDEKWYEMIEENEAGELSFTYYVGYSFITPDGERLTGDTQLSAQEWSALVEGGDIKILYSKLDPTNNRIDDTRFRPLLMCIYIPFIILCLFFLVQGWNILAGEFKKTEKIPQLVRSNGESG